MLKRKLNLEKNSICLPEFATVMSVKYNINVVCVNQMG